ncbi:DMT family transporter [Elioraea sp. Yellowstone]|jgi:drug/metabolite transporter (DMT)-like permease|uniref:DMT family transporter n=1 Tax=Elioraea sp. Yellowstone TaxID=2592070 RepID=UPI0011542C9E|nr:DMT family transporter [Elioraea sp. Yellowstone]TQF77282.1 DMT family transporter [Elioraea sp. Yellowstone]
MPGSRHPQSLAAPSRPAASQPAWRRAALLLALAALFWAGNFVMGRAVRGEIPPVALAFWRWLVAAAVLLPFTGRELLARRGALRRHALLLAALGLSGVGSFNTLSYIALTGTEAINAMLVISLTPLAILVAAFLIDGERPGARRLAALAVSLAGVATIAARGDPAALVALRLNPADGIVLLAVLGWGIYSVLLRRIPRGTFSPLGLLTATVLFGLALLLPSWLAEIALTGAMPRADLPTALAVLYAALAASIGAYLCWNGGVALIGPAASGPFLHLQPLFGTALAMLLLGEVPHGFHAVGFALVLAGVALAGRAPARR